MGGFFSKGKPYVAPVVASKHFTAFVEALPSLAGKTVAVTGTTSGTGFAAALACARKGAAVVLLNRPSPRATAALTKLRELSPPGASFTAVECDLQSFSSVRAAAATMTASLASLDVLCNNAGVMALADAATMDGYDVQMQTNHLSHFLLTREVMPLLEAAAATHGEARVVQHSSLARMGGPLEAKYLGANGGALGGNGNSMLFGGARWIRYHQSKLANAVFTVELAARLKAAGSNVQATVAAPGFSATNLVATANADDGMPDTWFMKHLAQSAEDGAMPLLTCMAAAGVKSGDFYEPGDTVLRAYGVAKKFGLEKVCTDKKAGTMLWEESERACGEFKLNPKP